MNTTKPGLPDYVGPNEGVALWVHHERPIEYCYSFTERVAYILASKPPHEQALRRTALTYLGDGPATQAYAQAAVACLPARTAYTAAWRASEAWAAYQEAQTAYQEAWRAVTEASTALPWRDLAAQHAPEVPYTDHGTLDFQAFNARQGA